MNEAKEIGFPPSTQAKVAHKIWITYCGGEENLPEGDMPNWPNEAALALSDTLADIKALKARSLRYCLALVDIREGRGDPKEIASKALDDTQINGVGKDNERRTVE